MRRGYNSCWLLDSDKHMIGINLGADFCAEHEWGIEELREVLGVDNDENVLGIDRYRVKNPKMDGVRLIEESKNSAGLLIFRPFEWQWLKDKKLGDYRELHLSSGEELATAWSKDDLGIRVHRPKNIKHLKRIYKAIEDQEAAVWLGGGGVFQNAGLCIGLINDIPQHNKDEMYKAHEDARKLKEASDATGIKQKIDAFNEQYRVANEGTRAAYDPPCGYYALKPGWISDKRTSAHPVMYWLNPQEQQKNKYGWYTVEDLEQWMEGKGPILSNAS